ncbi:hypothetical protein AZA_87510 [Nitrospirillum viridazoti Y2]|nr:hypothetical protein AZA_87510 [Nitrospirillum amazonense Y2]
MRRLRRPPEIGAGPHDAAVAVHLAAQQVHLLDGGMNLRPFGPAHRQGAQQPGNVAGDRVLVEHLAPGTRRELRMEVTGVGHLVAVQPHHQAGGIVASNRDRLVRRRRQEGQDHGTAGTAQLTPLIPRRQVGVGQVAVLLAGHRQRAIQDQEFLVHHQAGRRGGEAGGIPDQHADGTRGIVMAQDLGLDAITQAPQGVGLPGNVLGLNEFDPGTRQDSGS